MGLIKESGAYLASGIKIGPFSINFYALCILSGIIIAFFLTMREAKKCKMDTDKLFNGIVIGVIVGILGARLYYVIFEFKSYIKNPIEIFEIWNGGLAIHGGIIAGFLFAYFYCKKQKLNFVMVADFLAIALLIGQICGRWGNFFNQEAHGGATTYEFLKSLHLPRFIIKQMCIDGTYYHPTFLYESLWNLVALIALLILRKFRTIRLGDTACIYMIWYGIGRFFIEGMRTDSLMIGPIKQNQLISILLVIAGIVLIVLKYVKCHYDFYCNYAKAYLTEDEEIIEDIDSSDATNEEVATSEQSNNTDSVENSDVVDDSEEKRSVKEENEVLSDEEIIAELNRLNSENNNEKNSKSSKYIVDDEEK